MSCPLLIFVLDHFEMFILDLSMIYINTKILANNNNCHNQSKINVQTVGVNVHCLSGLGQVSLYQERNANDRCYDIWEMLGIYL